MSKAFLFGVGGKSGGTSNYEDLIDGSITEFVMPSGKTTIIPYLFRYNTKLVNVDLTGATVIGVQAFYGASNINITKPLTTITKINNQAFNNASTSPTNLFDLSPINRCSVWNSAFYGCKGLKKISGNFSNIENTAFRNCTNLQEIDMNVDSYIATQAFSGCTSVEKVTLIVSQGIGTSAFEAIGSGASTVDLTVTVKGGKIDDTAFGYCGNVKDCYIKGSPTYIGNNAFYGMGNQILGNRIFDFSTGTFKAIGIGAFNQNTTLMGNHIEEIRLPPTLVSLNAGDIRGTVYRMYLYASTPPTLDNNAIPRDSNRIFVPFNNLSAYKNAKYWSDYNTKIAGFAQANTFTQGDTLPTTNTEGISLTWYSDFACTNEVTTVSDETAEYYCKETVTSA